MGTDSGAPPAPEQQGTGGRMVYCVKLKRQLPGLEEVPFDGHPLGQRVFEHVSKQAWQMWVDQMRIIMNEYRLNLADQRAQEFLLKQMEEFFFGKGSQLPPEYVPPESGK